MSDRPVDAGLPGAVRPLLSATVSCSYTDSFGNTHTCARAFSLTDSDPKSDCYTDACPFFFSDPGSVPEPKPVSKPKPLTLHRAGPDEGGASDPDQGCAL